jgi:protoheme ferro-lyase
MFLTWFLNIGNLLLMATPTLLSIIESSGHPNASEFYRSIGVKETKINSMRKAIAAIKKQQPDFIVAEFFYGYGNNYAGVNISNLDVLLYSMQKYAPDTKVIVLGDCSRSPGRV